MWKIKMKIALLDCSEDQLESQMVKLDQFAYFQISIFFKFITCNLFQQSTVFGAFILLL